MAGSIDVTGFVGRYKHLRTQELAAPLALFVPAPHILVASRFGNQLDATTRGLEVAGQLTPMPGWLLGGSYTAFHLTPKLAASSQDPAAASEDGSAPQAQWQVRSAFSPGTRATLNVALFHVGRLEQFDVDAYTRTDVNAEWQLTRDVSAMAIGQNLFDLAHAEFGGRGSFLRVTQVPRSASLRLRWTFR
jgi:iron complex outermembrane receptor protein